MRFFWLVDVVPFDAYKYTDMLRDYSFLVKYIENPFVSSLVGNLPVPFSSAIEVERLPHVQPPNTKVDFAFGKS